LNSKLKSEITNREKILKLKQRCPGIQKLKKKKNIAKK
jgi:hypothetical protein